MNVDEKKALLDQIPQTFTYQANQKMRDMAEKIEKLKDPLVVAEYCFNYVRDLIEKA